jgi:hypothetical protein
MCRLVLLLALCAAPKQGSTETAAALGLEHVRVAKSTDAVRARLDVAREQAAFDARRVRIEVELETLGEHEWAGTYYAGDGLGAVVLQVAPRAGATYSSLGCVGLYDLNHGAIASVSPDGLELELAVAPALNRVVYQAFLPQPYVSSRWIRVRWGDERLLIPDCQMIPFCNAVNAGGRFIPSFPCRVVSDDWNRWVERPASPPEVPPAYGPFLLAEPLTTEIVTSAEPKAVGRFNGSRAVEFLVSATVGIGAESGLLPGMELHAQEPPRGIAVVVGVEPSRATVEFRTAISDAKRDTPRPGWTLSTRLPERVR